MSTHPTALGIAADVRAGKVKAASIAQDTLARITTGGDSYNAFTAMTQERALARHFRSRLAFCRQNTNFANRKFKRLF